VQSYSGEGLFGLPLVPLTAELVGREAPNPAAVMQLALEPAPGPLTTHLVFSADVHVFLAAQGQAVNASDWADLSSATSAWQQLPAGYRLAIDGAKDAYAVLSRWRTYEPGFLLQADLQVEDPSGLLDGGTLAQLQQQHGRQYRLSFEQGGAGLGPADVGRLLRASSRRRASAVSTRMMNLRKAGALASGTDPGDMCEAAAPPPDADPPTVIFDPFLPSARPFLDSLWARTASGAFATETFGNYRLWATQPAETVVGDRLTPELHAALQRLLLPPSEACVPSCGPHAVCLGGNGGTRECVCEPGYYRNTGAHAHDDRCVLLEDLCEPRCPEHASCTPSGTCLCGPAYEPELQDGALAACRRRPLTCPPGTEEFERRCVRVCQNDDECAAGVACSRDPTKPESDPGKCLVERCRAGYGQVQGVCRQECGGEKECPEGFVCQVTTAGKHCMPERLVPESRQRPQASDDQEPGVDDRPAAGGRPWSDWATFAALGLVLVVGGLVFVAKRRTWRPSKNARDTDS
jgi:hypothetical protein